MRKLQKKFFQKKKKTKCLKNMHKKFLIATQKHDDQKCHKNKQHYLQYQKIF